MTQLLLTTPLQEIYGYTELREKMFQQVIKGENFGTDQIDSDLKEFEDDLIMLSINLHQFISANLPLFCPTVDASNLKFDEFGCLRLQLPDDVKYPTQSPLSQNQADCTPTEISMCASIACVLWFCEYHHGKLPNEIHNLLIYWSERLKQVKSDSYETVEGFDALSVTKIID